MWLFKRKKLDDERISQKETAVRVEVQHHKDTTEEAVKQAKKTTDQFNRLLKKNGITLKIHIATTGGRHVR